MTIYPIRVPVIEEIKLDDIRIDPSYQRNPLDSAFLSLKKRIVVSYDPALLHPLDISRWDNFNEGYPSNFCYDGYCRLEALKELRELGKYGETVRCSVISVPTDEQARLFIGQTDRRNVAWSDKHRARLAYLDPSALAIEAVFKSLGLVLGKGGDVGAVQACYSTVEIDRVAANPNAPLRGDLLSHVLNVAGTSWTTDGTLKSGVREQYATSDRMIDALALVLNKFTDTELPHSDLAAALRKTTPPSLVQKAAKKTSAHGSNNKTALAAEILTQFNKLSGKKLRKDRITRKKR